MPFQPEDYELVPDSWTGGYRIQRSYKGCGSAIVFILFVIMMVTFANAYNSASPSSQPLIATPSTSLIATNFTSLSFYRKTPVLSDPLHDNSKGYSWEISQDKLGGVCQFIGGGYHATMPTPNYVEYCTAKSSNFDNFAFQVKMMIVKGDGGGIVFRADPGQVSFYYFYISSTGSWKFSVFHEDSSHVLISGASSNINVDLNQINLIAVVANGNTFNLYINNQQIESVNDNTYSHGQIAVFAQDENEPTDIIFSDVKVWKL